MPREQLGDLRDVIARRPGQLVAVAPDDALRVAYARMRLHDVSQLPVLEAGQLVGILDESDLLVAALAGGKAFDTRPAPTRVAPPLGVPGACTTPGGTKRATCTCVATSVRAFVKNLMLEHVLGHVPGVVRRGPLDAAPRVALTFDDGPDELTPRYLAVLDELGVPATFFVCGERATQHPDLIREYLRRGHQVASHGYDHTRFPALSHRALLAQLDRTEFAIGGQVTGRPWVRPPHGALDATSLVTLRSAGYTVALWSLDSLDHEERDPARIATRRHPPAVGPGEVLLLHEGQPWTLEALPRIIEALHAAGLECVTMHDLFAR